MSKAQVYDRARVGGDILCFCSRCKLSLAHVVTAMVEGRAKRVICKTCKSEHGYRAGGVEGRITHRAALRQKTVILASEYWQTRINESKGEPVPYAPTATFRKGDVMAHPKFGLGCVEEVRLSGKILVFFRDGEKILIHAL